MKNTNKIAAFTISEMVVVLIITSIVVGLAFSVLTLVKKHMSGIQTNFKQKTEFNRLEQSLWLDMNRFSSMTYIPIEEAIVFKNNIDSIAYYFNSKTIIREMDTFRIPVKQKTLYFTGDVVKRGIIDAVKLKTSQALGEQILFVFKENDATYFVNHGI